MALTTLDLRTALLVIDLQRGILALPAAHPLADVVQQAATLAAAFRRHALPVVLVTVAGGAPGRNEMPPRPTPPAGWDELAPQLDRQPQDHHVVKRSWGAFSGTGLAEYLQERGITQVVIAGVATSVGVESTARQAYELGFNVTLASDAMSDMSAEAHQHSLTRIFPRLGETGSVAEIVALLERTRA